MTTEDFKQLFNTIPKEPGIYRFMSPEGAILYVGKAKNLRNRLSSYFGERQDRAQKTRVMVKHAGYIEFMVVESETDALLLESTLIKEHQPRYNVMLKDGKTYSISALKMSGFPG